MADDTLTPESPTPSGSEIRWRVSGASVCGSGHQRHHQPCQDACQWQVVNSRWLVAAVADGAGSATHAEIGARLVVETVVAHLTAQISANQFQVEADEVLQTSLTNAFQLARTKLEQEAETHGIALRELATTLVVVVAHPEVVAVAQIGDGAAVVKPQRLDPLALTTPHTGEYLNQTLFLTAPQALTQIQTVVWRGSLAQLALFTDGLQLLALKLPEATAHRPFFAPLFQFMAEETDPASATEQLVGFLNSNRIRERTDDDLTLVLATIE
ncbi:MAG TPA: PP2C family serine/threonine-protein phosphatase [Acidobacteriota bacterium]|nr:PP2C family serine/threonine-protein phosphatase [Acidobacteriota bacterium]HND21123.1 PP2C family serine/threonine-protein phosphatase [Acidobacteriota bacterium]